MEEENEILPAMNFVVTIPSGKYYFQNVHMCYLSLCDYFDISIFEKLFRRLSLPALLICLFVLCILSEIRCIYAYIQVFDFSFHDSGSSSSIFIIFGILIMFSNEFATLSLCNHALRKKVNNYVIRFHSEQIDLNVVMEKSFEIFKVLIDDYRKQSKMISARLIALVKYCHIENEENVTYYFPSYSSEIVYNHEILKSLLKTQMLKNKF